MMCKPLPLPCSLCPTANYQSRFIRSQSPEGLISYQVPILGLQVSGIISTSKSINTKYVLLPSEITSLIETSLSLLHSSGCIALQEGIYLKWHTQGNRSSSDSPEGGRQLTFIRVSKAHMCCTKMGGGPLIFAQGQLKLGCISNPEV